MKLLYFAWLRAKLGKGSEELVPPPSVTTVGALLERQLVRCDRILRRVVGCAAVGDDELG